MGSKSRITKDIVPIIQKAIDDNNINIYIEPFVGGANVIDKIKCRKRIGNDLNVFLIELLKYVRNGGELPESISREEYNIVRAAYNNKELDKFPLWYFGAVGFLASYNGRWFDSGYAQAGYKKNKNGLRYQDYYRKAKDNLLKQVSKLKDVQFTCADYRIIKVTNSLIYCDPPYANTKQYSNSKDFDYNEFWETMREWSKNNIVYISELQAPDDFECVWEKEVYRSINAHNKNRAKSRAVEKLFKLKE